MREFYLLSYEDREGLQVVNGYDLGTFDTSVFRTGLPFEGRIPSDARMYVSEGEISDLLANAKSWPIVSKKLLNIVSNFSNDLQIIDPPLFTMSSKQPVLDYKIMNVTRRLKAVDMRKSKVRPMNILGEQHVHVLTQGFAFRESSIPGKVHVFRPLESPEDLVISGEVAGALAGKVQGVALIPTETV